MNILDRFRKIAGEPFNPHLQAYKENDGKIIGAFCSYVPEEMIMAAGMTPFRMRAVGSTKTALGDIWFSSFNCSYVRHLFDLALDHKFQFLDGLVFINSCDHIRRMFDNWKAALGYPSFLHMLAVPRKNSESAVKWYYQELQILRDKLQEHFQTSITDQALRESIQVSNQTRSLLSKLYEMRKDDSPPITGAETLSVIMAGTALPRPHFNQMLDELIEEIPGRQAYPPDTPRLMIQSGCLELHGDP